jgi:hypothetical protein
MGAADIDHNAICLKGIGDEGGINHEGRTVQGLRRPEHGSLEGMSDHDVVTNFDTMQRRPPHR